MAYFVISFNDKAMPEASRRQLNTIYMEKYRDSNSSKNEKNFEKSSEKKENKSQKSSNDTRSELDKLKSEVQKGK